MADQGIKSAARVHVRWMTRRDMTEVVDIERRTFVDEPLTEEEILRFLRERNVIGMVAEELESLTTSGLRWPPDSTKVKLRGRVVGFMIYRFLKRSIFLIDLAVHPSFRDRGVGKALIGKLISKLTPDRRNAIDLVIAESNLAAQCFLRSQGFLATEIVRDLFNGEDAYAMSYEIDKWKNPEA